MFACEMPIKSADSLWAINVIPSSYALRTSTDPRGTVGWIAIRRPIIPSGWLMSAKLCRSKEGGPTGRSSFSACPVSLGDGDIRHEDQQAQGNNHQSEFHFHSSSG